MSHDKPADVTTGSTESARRLLLIGGGHAHVEVLRRFGLQSIPGTRITLVSPQSMTSYSGMLPGLIAGHYTFEQTHVDLRSLCQFAKAEFIEDPAAGLDLNERHVRLGGGGSQPYDVLSIDIGSAPNTHGVPGASQYALPIKPVGPFLSCFEQMVGQIDGAPELRWRILVVGGGAGGVELLLAVRNRIVRRSDRPRYNTEFHLVTDSRSILPSHNPRTRRLFEELFRQHQIRVHLRQRVVEVAAGEAKVDEGESLSFDFLVWAAGAGAAGWLADSGLSTDQDGFVNVRDTLQSISHPGVFAAGDVASFENRPLPKAGVFAVRQGPVLARNLRAALSGRSLQSYQPQKQFLTIITTGDQNAVASKGNWSVSGGWVWKWKNWIDQRWMRRYRFGK